MSKNTDWMSLAATFERHAEDEGAILAEYRVLAERLGDSAAGMLVNQILTDEEMHHLLLRTIAGWLARPEGAGTPSIPLGADRRELLRLTEALATHEAETIEACRTLRLRSADATAELVDTLLEVLRLDSEKHQRLLAAVAMLLRR